MSITMICEIILTFLQVLILACGILFFMRRRRNSENAAFRALFIFGLLNLLMCNLYWLAYDILRPDLWMPIAADEIAEAAANLLLAACLGIHMGKEKNKFHLPEFAFTFLYMMANASFWAIWSEEWIQSFLVAIPYIFLLYRTICGLNRSGAATKLQKVMLLVPALLVIVLQYIRLTTDEETALVLDHITYALMPVSLLILLYIFIKAKNSGSAAGGKRLYVSVLIYLWTMLCSFLSDGIFYSIALAETDLSLPLVFMAVAKEMPHDDLS